MSRSTICAVDQCAGVSIATVSGVPCLSPTMARPSVRCRRPGSRADTPLPHVARSRRDVGFPVLLLLEPPSLNDVADILEQIPGADVIVDHRVGWVVGNDHHLQMLATWQDTRGST